MTSYAEMARERKKARSLYLELRALGLELYTKEDSREATGYRVRIAGLHSLSETHAERIRRRVEASKPGLLRVLFGRWDPDVLAIQQEGISMKMSSCRRDLESGFVAQHCPQNVDPRDSLGEAPFQPATSLVMRVR